MHGEVVLAERLGESYLKVSPTTKAANRRPTTAALTAPSRHGAAIKVWPCDRGSIARHNVQRQSDP